MFKKLYTAIGVYSFCVFIYKLNKSVVPVASRALDRLVDDLESNKDK